MALTPARFTLIHVLFISYEELVFLRNLSRQGTTCVLILHWTRNSDVSKHDWLFARLLKLAEKWHAYLIAEIVSIPKGEISGNSTHFIVNLSTSIFGKFERLWGKVLQLSFSASGTPRPVIFASFLSCRHSDMSLRFEENDIFCPETIHWFFYAALIRAFE